VPACERRYASGNKNPCSAVIAQTLSTSDEETTTMRGILLWLIGIPIPIIILLYLFNVL
jgi:hypothetical protein